MSKQEETYRINDELIDEKIEVPVKSNKIKYIIAIATTLTIVAATSILLIGHFKFGWFKSEIYKLNANIHRAAYQTNYFTETKTINTEYSFTNGNKEKKKAIVNTNFVVVITDRKELEKDNFLNTASLIILDSKVKGEEIETKLTDFNIFDENIMKEIESNPNGSKYPMAMFKFYDEGIITEINVPDNMDKYNADSIVELIQNVIPRLKRNKTEDMSNGLEITEKKNKNAYTIVEAGLDMSWCPGCYSAAIIIQFGNIWKKITHRNIENEQLTDMTVDTSAYFEEDDLENADFGIKDFLYKTNSEIKAVKTTENKEVADIVEKISNKFNFIPNQKLIENILEKEKQEKEQPLEIIDLEEDTNSLRKLGFNFNVDKTFNIKTISFLGQSFTIKYRIAVKNGNAINQLIISSNLGTATFGNGGISYEFSKTFSARYQIFKYVFPPFPAITLGVYAGGSLSISVKFTSNSKTTLKLSLGGSLTATAEVKAGWDPVLSFSAGATGTVVSASGYATITGGSVSKGYSISGGKIVCYVVAKAAGKQVWKKEHTVFNGWSS